MRKAYNGADIAEIVINKMCKDAGISRDDITFFSIIGEWPDEIAIGGEKKTDRKEVAIVSDVTAQEFGRAGEFFKKRAIEAMRAEFGYTMKFISLKTGSFHEHRGIMYVEVHGMTQNWPELKKEHMKHTRSPGPWGINDRSFSLFYNTKSGKMCA